MRVTGSLMGKTKALMGKRSLLAAMTAWALLSALTVFVLWGLRDRARLIRDNETERILNTLSFASMRRNSDLNETISANPFLLERVAGIAVYEDSLEPAFRWGITPDTFDESLIPANEPARLRYTIPNKKKRSVLLIMRAAPASNAVGSTRRMPRMSFFGQPNGKYVYLDIKQSAYYRALTISGALFCLCEVIFLLLAFAIRRLYLKNREYREKIETQEKLAALGGAASTLAHEIKNPLLAIRIQTGILRKLDGEACAFTQELGIIDEEIERISALIYRVNDYLREPRGTPSPVDARVMVRETAVRLCGQAFFVRALGGLGSSSYGVLIDSERFRSILENGIRNALESGSSAEELGAILEKKRRGGGNVVVLSIVDRGKSVADTSRAFDPFYTTKSSGTGIGLAISRRFAEAAGGSLTLENREGGGARLVLVLPEHAVV